LDAFRLEQLPAHLLMNYRVIDEHGRQLGMSRNFSQLHGELAPRAAPVIVTVDKQAPLAEQRSTTWNFGAFTQTREVLRAGQNVILYNALVDDADAACLRDP
jgi:ATP-dependent helicase HrpA